MTGNPGASTPLLLTGAVQHYAWGGFDYIPNLLGIDNPERRPFAELWLGAHPSAPALAQTEAGPVRLDTIIDASPLEMLGESVARQFGVQLPFLLKLLDARQMLSIQAHPTKEQAKAGFARENAAGIPIDSPKRNYRDENHKPEVHVALTEFWMLHGFRPMGEIAARLEDTTEFVPLARFFRERTAAGGSERSAMRELYRHVMTLPQAGIDGMLDPLVRRLERESPADRMHPDYWALRAARTFPLPEGGRDRGILSTYLLNLVQLRPGEGTYQPAGVLHAYLEGTNVELMANSDNVLRGGLTPKHVDVEELLHVVDFRCERPEILRGSSVSAEETRFRTSAGEFELSRITLPPGSSLRMMENRSPQIWVVLEGDATIETAVGRPVRVGRGQAVFIPPGSGLEAGAGEAQLDVFRAAVPSASSGQV